MPWLAVLVFILVLVAALLVRRGRAPLVRRGREPLVRRGREPSPPPRPVEGGSAGWRGESPITAPTGHELADELYGVRIGHLTNLTRVGHNHIDPPGINGSAEGSTGGAAKGGGGEGRPGQGGEEKGRPGQGSAPGQEALGRVRHLEGP